MKRFIIIYFFTAISLKINAQATRVAILDFENISGIAKYDGLGKAMSSMLISDIEANVSPKRLQLVERSQIQKILKEQKFQASGSVNKNTAVQTGKILGVNYLLVGDIYILNDQLIINARLTNTKTGDIVFSKKQEGKAVAWLTLKTAIAKDLASSLSLPFTEPVIPDKELTVATISTFGNAVAAKDTGNINKAEELINVVKDFSPDFSYIEDLKKELEIIQKQTIQNTKDISKLQTDIQLLTSSFENSENIYFSSPSNRFQFLSNAVNDYRKGDYKKAIISYENYFSYGDTFFDPYAQYVNILSLPEFENEKKAFLNKSNLNTSLNEKICFALLQDSRRRSLNSLNNLMDSKPSALVYYLICKFRYEIVKNNISLNWEFIKKSTKIYDSLLLINNDVKSYFIDKISYSNEVESVTDFYKLWKDSPFKMLDMFTSYNIPLSTVINNGVLQYKGISVEEWLEVIDKYYKSKQVNGVVNKSFLTTELIGKYCSTNKAKDLFGKDSRMEDIHQCIEINDDKIDYADLKNIPYIILNNTICFLPGSGLFLDFKIIDSNSLEYNDGVVKKLFKKEY